MYDKVQYHNAMNRINAVEYSDSTVERRTAQLTKELAEEMDRIKNDETSWTKSNVLNEALRQYLHVGELAALEQEICRDLVERGYPVPVSCSYDHPEGLNVKNKIFIKTGGFQTEKINKDEFNRRESHPHTVKLTEENIEAVKWASKSSRSKSVVYINALVEWVGMAFSDRYDRVRSVRQLLKASRGEEVENPTDFVTRRQQGTKLASEPEDVRVYEDIFTSSFDISEVRPADSVVLSEEEVIEARENGELKQTRTNRVGVLCATLRDKEKSVWSVDEIRRVNERINSDIKTERTRENYVTDAINFVDTGVRFPAEKWNEAAKLLVHENIKHIPKGAKTVKGRLKRKRHKEEYLEWLEDQEGEFKAFYDDMEEMGRDVLTKVIEAVREDAEGTTAMANNAIQMSPQEMWENEYVRDMFAESEFITAQAPEPVITLLEGRGVEFEE